MKKTVQVVFSAAGVALFQVIYNSFYFLSSLIPPDVTTENPLSFSLNEVFSTSFLMNFKPEMSFLPGAINRMAFFFVFCLFACRFLAKDYCLTGVYTFTRQVKKSHWYVKRVGNLAGFAFLYTAVYLGLGLICCFSVAGGELVDTKELLYLILSPLVNYTLFLTAISLLINLISIQFGSSAGFIGVWLAIVLCLTLLFSAYPVVMEPLLRSDPELQHSGYLATQLPLWMLLLVAINPLSHVILNFHAAPSELVNLSLSNRMQLSGNIEFINLPSWMFSIGYLLVFTVITVSLGWLYLRKKDISLINHETL